MEGPFDHFWGPLNVIDFESTRPFFESQLTDNDEFKDVNYSSLESVFDHEPSNSSSTEVEYKGNIAEMNWEHGKISSPISSSPGLSPVQSPYLTIPPGISPAALLESPVMLPNSQHSPTTGTFPMAAACDDDNSVINSFSPQTDRDRDRDRDSDIVVDSFGMFMFKPPPGDFATHMPCTSNTGHQTSTSSKLHAEATKRDSASFSNMELSTENEIEDRTMSISDHVNLQSPPVDIVDHHQEPLLKKCVKVETEIHPLFESEEKGIPASTKTSNAGDGYYWRKYGQKHVKGSEYPRSYYKCNNSNCPVKKKVERSHEGEITEIIYNGGHNHPKPHPRLSLGSRAISSEMLDPCEVLSGYPKLEGWTGRTCNQLMTPSASSDWTADGLERTPSAPVLNEICDPSSISQETPATLFGSVKTPENAKAIGSQNGDDQDGMMQWSTSPSEDADGDESEPKRRKRDTLSSEAYLPASRSIREPRIILQIESEIDVLDDGYRWRKYGQKVVKGNPNPRSYYKCTSAGCPVRKHVERASEDIKSVITTYEGKHNHEVPTTKKMGAPNVGQSPPNVSGSNAMLMLPNVSNVDMKVQDFPIHYQMKPAIGNELVRSSLLGDYVSDMKLGVSSIYQMKFSPLQSLPMPYSPFMMNSNGNEVHTSSFGTPLMHDLPMIGASINTNMAVNSFHSNNYPRRGGVIQGSIGMQQIKENDFRFFKPKEEQKDDNSYNTTPDDEKLSSTTFCRAMGKFPS